METKEYTKDPILDKIKCWIDESEKNKTGYIARWSKNIQLIKGVFPADEVQRSKIRGRSKLFFRKIWASNWRILASAYNALLKDYNNFKIIARGEEDVHDKEKILQIMTEYRRDRMEKYCSLFTQLLWGLMNIIELGWCCGKMWWDSKNDRPMFKLWRNEDVFPDLSAETKSEMRYIIFRSYMTKDEMEEAGFENIDKASFGAVPFNQLRASRFAGNVDPIQGSGEHEYPKAGEGPGEDDEKLGNERCQVYEAIYRYDGKVHICISDGKDIIFKKERVSPYKDNFPVAMGYCLLTPHSLIGEGFPEPLEGPQESLNDTINKRKDNVALCMNKGMIVSRYGNVDLESIVNYRSGGITLTDDINAVKERDMSDVTQSSYVEAQADVTMIEEMSGVTAGKQGMGEETKATVASINFQESNMKIDLFISIMAKTFIKDFYDMLIFMIQRFDTDKKIFRICNDMYRGQNPEKMANPDINTIDDFEADAHIEVGLGTMSRDIEVKQTLLAMDRAIMANQSTLTLMKLGGGQNGSVRLFDLTKFMDDLLPKIGKKNTKDYYMEVNVPPPQQEVPMNPAVSGMVQPQIGNGSLPIQGGPNGL